MQKQKTEEVPYLRSSYELKEKRVGHIHSRGGIEKKTKTKVDEILSNVSVLPSVVCHL